MSGILIQNGYMVNPAENKEGYADIRIRDGIIERIEFRGRFLLRLAEKRL